MNQYFTMDPLQLRFQPPENYKLSNSEICGWCRESENSERKRNGC
jgi:hypothetical protein